MARNNMTFTAALKLDSKAFSRGVKDIQKSLNGLKSSFLSFAGALGAGLGLNQLVSSMKDTATQLSIARNTLKNTAEGAYEYAESMQFLKRISNDYGQDLMSLTNNFAKFRAAAAGSKLEIDDLRKIYESLTRAAGAYHMTSSQATDAMRAVEQMMSKGKIAAEELRRQLGNSLPGAFNLMAKAAQVAGISTNGTTAELEDLMKKGKVAAEDILPSFAKVLNEATRSADFDSLQSSLNRLKNSFTNFVDKTGFEQSFQKIIDKANAALVKLGDNLKSIKQLIIATLIAVTSVKGGKNIFSWMSNASKQAIVDFDNARASFNKLEKKMSSSSFSQKFTQVGVGKSGLPYLDVNTEGYKFPAAPMTEFENAAKYAIDYNNALVKLHNTQKKLSGKGFLSKKDIKTIQEVNAELNKNISLGNRLAKTGTMFGRAWRTAIGMVKTAFASIGIGLIIAGISYVIEKTVEWKNKSIELKKELERINSIYSEYEKGYEKLNNANTGGTSDSYINLRKSVEALKDCNKNSERYQGLLADINTELGLTGDNALTIKSSYEDIVKTVDKWIEKQKTLAKLNYQLSKQDEAMASNVDLKDKLKDLEKEYQKKTGFALGGFINLKTGENLNSQYGLKGTGVANKAPRTKWITDNVLPVIQEINQNNKVIDAATEEIANLKSTLADVFKSAPNGDDITSGGTKSNEKTPSSVISDYNKSINELNNQYANGAISTEEYDKQLAKVTQDAWEALAAFDAWDKVLKQLSGKDKNTANFIKDNTDALTFKANFNEIGNEINNEVENYFEEFAKQGEEDIKNAIEKWKSAFDEYLDVKDKEGKLSKTKERDSTYDYMYNPNRKKGEILSELQVEAIKGTLDIKLDNIDDWENLKAELEEGLSEGKFGDFAGQISGILDEIIDKIKELKGEATTMQHVLNLNELQTEINDLKKDILETSWDSFTQLAEGTDRIVKGFQTLKETMNDVDSTPFERMMAVVNLFIQTMETLCTITKTFTMLTELAGKIKEKSAAKEIAANAGVVVSEEVKTGALAKTAIAGAASSQAGIPLLGPILAATAVAGIIALLMSSMGKFAKGGIVNYGSTSGDETLARVNKGEGILTAEGVKNLQSLYNNQGGVGGQVQFKIRGSDLIGVINNEQSRRRG